MSMIVEEGNIHLITYLSLEEFKRIQDRIIHIQKEHPSVVHIEEPFSPIQTIHKDVFSPSEIEGIGRTTIDKSFIFKKTSCETTSIRFIFSKSCPIELIISFDVTLNDYINNAVIKIKECCKKISTALTSLIGISTYKLCFCTLYMAEAPQEQTIKEQLKQMDIAFKNVSIIDNIVVFRREYTDLHYDIWFILILGKYADEIEIAKRIEKMPIIEKVGQTIMDGLEDFNDKIIPIENNLAQMEKLVKNRDLDELTSLRIKYLNLKSKLLKYKDMYYSLQEYLDIFVAPLESILKKENNGLLYNETRRLKRYYLRKIEHLLSKLSKKLEDVQCAIDSSIETVNIKETIKLGKVNLKLQKWLIVLTILLFIIALIELFSFLGGG